MLMRMEECAEVSVECSKIIRFDDATLTNLEKEIGDLLCMIDILHQQGHLDAQRIINQVHKKRQKLEKWSNLFKS